MFSRTVLYRNRAAVRDNIHQEGGLSNSRGNRSRNKNLLPYNNNNNIVVGHRWTMEDGTRWNAWRRSRLSCHARKSRMWGEGSEQTRCATRHYMKRGACTALLNSRNEIVKRRPDGFRFMGLISRVCLCRRRDIRQTDAPNGGWDSPTIRISCFERYRWILFKLEFFHVNFDFLNDNLRYFDPKNELEQSYLI